MSPKVYSVAEQFCQIFIDNLWRQTVAINIFPPRHILILSLAQAKIVATSI
jgi:hypothetical protein